MWLLLLLTFTVVLTLAACSSPPPAKAPGISAAPVANDAGTPSASTPANEDVIDVRLVRRALTAQEAASYLGDKVCASCHKNAAAVHVRSRHAHTLRPVSLALDGANFRKAQSLTDSNMGYTYTPMIEKGRCALSGRSKRGQAALPADYVMGNGHNAFTYLSRDDTKGWVELRLSYYPQAGKWDYTPTQLAGAVLKRAAGRVQTNTMLTSCLLCHTTVLRASVSSPVPKQLTAGTGSEDDPLPDLAASSMGVGCERCHGPGRTHVELATKAGAKAATAALSAEHETYGMEDLHHASPERINFICGYCHRTTENASPGPHTEMNMARFQGVALARSACYQKSGTLSCLTCHDAHGNANPSLSRNDAICLRCHSEGKPQRNETRGGKGADEAKGAKTIQTPHDVAPYAQAVQGKLCPVNPRTGCTACHMPKTAGIMPYSLFTNHLIKVWPSGSSPSSDALRQ